MELLSAKNISKQYTGHLALNNVSLSVKKNSIFGLLGPNGAGKTTFLRIINQIIAPDTGSLLFNNEKLSPEHISKIGYLPEERGLYKKMKVGEHVLYLAQLKGLSKSEAKEKLEYWFDKFEISGWWNRRINELSKGMQQKVQFIVTVLHNPDLIILDEPFTGFDPINAKLIKEEILGFKEAGKTIIISTHNMESVEELCDDIALIDKSSIVLNGSVRDIKNEYKDNVYLVEFIGDGNKLKESLSEEFDILDSVKSDNLYTLKIKSKDSDTSNKLLEKIVQIGQVVSFNELLPSMNDIFIQKVKKS